MVFDFIYWFEGVCLCIFVFGCARVCLFGLFDVCVFLSELHTVLERSHNNWIRSGSITDPRAGQYPNLIIGPSFQFVQYDFRVVVECCDRRFTIGHTIFHEKYFIINDLTVGAFSWWRMPWYSYCCWAGRLCRNIRWWCTRNCVHFVFRWCCWCFWIWIIDYFRVHLFIVLKWNWFFCVIISFCVLIWRFDTNFTFGPCKWVSDVCMEVCVCVLFCIVLFCACKIYCFGTKNTFFYSNMI